MSEIQSVIFNKKYYSTDSARKWLKENNIVRMKRVDIAKNYLRYRIRSPDKYKSFITKPIKKGIKLVLGFK